MPLTRRKSACTGRSARYRCAGRSRAIAVRDVARCSAVRVRPYVWKGATLRLPAEPPDAWSPRRCPRAKSYACLGDWQPLVVALASQVAYLKSIASLSSFALPSRADARRIARCGAAGQRFSARLTQGDVDAELAVLAPLSRSTIRRSCGSLLSISRQPSAVSQPSPVASRHRLGEGLRDRWNERPRERQRPCRRALIKEVGLQKGQIGKIDVGTFSLVEVSPDAAIRPCASLGVSDSRRRVTARPDRG